MSVDVGVDVNVDGDGDVAGPCQREMVQLLLNAWLSEAPLYPRVGCRAGCLAVARGRGRAEPPTRTSSTRRGGWDAHETLPMKIAHGHVDAVAVNVDVDDQ